MTFCSCHLIMLSTCRPHITADTSQNKKNNFYFPCCNYICAKTNISSNAIDMPHMPISLNAGMRQLCQYMYLIWTQCNQQCLHWYTYISHYWHMPRHICLPHCICMPHYTTSVWYIKTPHSCIHM